MVEVLGFALVVVVVGLMAIAGFRWGQALLRDERHAQQRLKRWLRSRRDEEHSGPGPEQASSEHQDTLAPPNTNYRVAGLVFGWDLAFGRQLFLAYSLSESRIRALDTVGFDLGLAEALVEDGSISRETLEILRGREGNYLYWRELLDGFGVDQADDFVFRQSSSELRSVDFGVCW